MKNLNKATAQTTKTNCVLSATKIASDRQFIIHSVFERTLTGWLSDALTDWLNVGCAHWLANEEAELVDEQAALLFCRSQSNFMASNFKQGEGFGNLMHLKLTLARTHWESRWTYQVCTVVRKCNKMNKNYELTVMLKLQINLKTLDIIIYLIYIYFSNSLLLVLLL